jgi:serine/threonine protein kinase
VAAACLNHPNIITVFDFGQTAERYPYLVMEFLDGKDLHGEVGHSSLDLARCIRIVSQVCLALGHAHKRGVVHRDLKPSNIMLIDLEDLEDFVKIVDFGIAKRFDSEEDTIERLTAQGELLGTPAYMSP